MIETKVIFANRQKKVLHGQREIPTKLVVVGFVGIFYVAVGTIWVQNHFGS